MQDGNTKTLSRDDLFLSETWPRRREDRWQKADVKSVGGGKNCARQEGRSRTRSKAPKYYVYRVDHPSNGQFYIGSRTVREGDVTADTGYLGSGVWPQNMRTSGVKLVKTILNVYPERTAARKREKKLITQNHFNKRCMNRLHRSAYTWHTNYTQGIEGFRSNAQETCLLRRQASKRIPR